MSVVLCVDVGNSHTVVGIYRNNEIIEHARLSTAGNATSDEIFLRMRSLIQAAGISYKDLTHAALASVVPAMERVWVKGLNRLVQLPISVVNHENCLGLDIQYDLPSQLGSDRICNVLAIQELGYRDGIVIDLGTAVTFDVLKDNKFYGGVILPGINSSLEVLTQKAVRLLPVTLSWTDHVIARNTEDAIRSGVLYGFVGQLEFLVQRIKAEMQCPNVTVWATGGWSSLLMNKTSAINQHDPYLTLAGIRRVALAGKAVPAASI